MKIMDFILMTQSSTVQCTESLFFHSFWPCTHKKTSLKSPIALTAQKGPRLKIHVGNVSQDASLY
jgi:hypothetical protein